MKAKVLVVDDEYAFAQFARMLLEGLGHEVEVCIDGEEAVAQAKAGRPGLILMDLHVGACDGAELIRRLKAEPETKAIPILVCSMSRTRSEVEKAVSLGAAGFVPKPVSTESLRAGLDSALGGSR
ncbi:MAG: response regulator [Elusimicrobia bacterium]|nr:response regulator [Elusimicrobiota bacterium]